MKIKHSTRAQKGLWPIKCFKCGGLIVDKDADAGYHLSHNKKPKYRTQGDVWEFEQYPR